MNIFISYSVKNSRLVKQMVDKIKPHVDEVFWWQESQTPGEPAWPSIFEWIEESDIVLAVITDYAVTRAMAVGQEIGHANALGKIIIPLVASDVHDKDLGCLGGITYIRIDENDPGMAITNVVQLLKNLKFKEWVEALLWIIGIIGIIWYISRK